MLLDRSDLKASSSPQPVNTLQNNDPDWTVLTDAAMENADLDLVTPLPPLSEVIEIDDDGANDPPPLPPSLRQTLQNIPKLESELAHTTCPTTNPMTPPQTS